MSSSTDLVKVLQERLPELDQQEILELAQAAYPELEMRVGELLSEGLTDAQLEEFERLLDQGDEDGCAEWLRTHRPDHPEIVRAELAKLIDEIVTRVQCGTDATILRFPSSPPSPPAVVDDSARLRNWSELRHHLHSSFTCRLHGDRELSILIDLPEGRSQVVFVRDANEKWAEVHSGIGRGLAPDAISTALNALGVYIGVGAIARHSMLIARIGLPYEGLTGASASRCVHTVAAAADEAEQSATGSDEF